MTKVVILYVLTNGLFSGSMVRVSEYPDMAACKAAVTSNQLSLKSDAGLIGHDWQQGEWTTGKGDFICIEGYRP